MQKSFKVFILACVLVFAIFAIFRSTHQVPISSNFQTLHFTARATLASTTLSLAVADTQAAREIGLSNQLLLAPDHGLLFIFDTPDLHGFWMKEMRFPIDVVWFDASYRVSFIQKDFLPSSYPAIVHPDTPSTYVLELPAGFVQEHEIKLRDTLNFLNKS